MKCLACLPLLGFSNILIMVQLPIFNGFLVFLPLKGHLEFSGTFFLAEIFEKLSFHPYNARITRLSVRKSEQMKTLLVFSVTPFKIDQNKKSKPFNRSSQESGK